MDKNQNKIDIPRVCQIIEKGVTQVSASEWGAVQNCIGRIAQSSKFAHLFSKQAGEILNK